LVKHGGNVFGRLVEAGANHGVHLYGVYAQMPIEIQIELKTELKT